MEVPRGGIEVHGMYYTLHTYRTVPRYAVRRIGVVHIKGGPHDAEAHNVISALSWRIGIRWSGRAAGGPGNTPAVPVHHSTSSDVHSTDDTLPSSCIHTDDNVVRQW